MKIQQRIAREAASLMERLPLLYPKAKYDTPRRRFIIITEELFRMGFAATISKTQGPARIRAGRKVRSYSYHVIFNMQPVCSRKTRAAAKNYIFRQYLTEKQKHEQPKKD